MIKVAKNLASLEEQNKLVKLFEKWLKEVRKLLPDTPEDIEIYFDDWPMMPEFGCGGFTYSPQVLTIAFDIDFRGDKKKQLKDLKSTFYHECFHLVQGYYGGDGYRNDQLSMLENAIYEGAATIFERDYTGSDWCKYEDEVTMQKWVDEIKKFDPKSDDLKKLKFYDPTTGRKWVMYKVGAFLVDKVLSTNNKLSIIDLAKLDAKKILDLAKLV